MKSEVKSYPPHGRLETVTEATGLPRSTLYELMKTSGFPKPRKIGSRSIWDMAAVLDWMSANLTEGQHQ